MATEINSRIEINKIWYDDDVTEFTVVVCDGRSAFFNEVYVSCGHLQKLIKDLNVFREHVYGGLYDIKFGEFGPEYANGGFFARLHFHSPGRLFVSTYQQCEFEEFKETRVASEAKMFLKTEPVLLDNFIADLRALDAGTSDVATLVCT